MVCERPPRLRLLRWLRSILLMAQPPLLRKEGNTFGEFIHSCFQEKPRLTERPYNSRLLGACVAEVGGGDGPGFHTHGLRHHSEPFVPDLNGVCPGRYFIDLISAALAADCEIGMIDDPDVRGHPGVDVAAELDHDFFLRRLVGLNETCRRLPNIETGVLDGCAVQVVQPVVAVLDLQDLPNAHAHDAGNVDAPTLVDGYGLRGNRCLRKVPLQFYKN